MQQFITLLAQETRHEQIVNIDSKYLIGVMAAAATLVSLLYVDEPFSPNRLYLLEPHTYLSVSC